MFRSFFMTRRWCAWSLPGGALILFATWYKVELDVQINAWFGDFYNLIQKALGKPGSITMDEYLRQIATFGRIAGLYVLIAVGTDFFIKHYVFRWRAAMNEFYTAHWHAVRGIEGASQRVQEDTMRFARLMEGLGVSFIRSVMTLLAFVPILWTLSAQVAELPWIGPVSHSLVWVAIFSRWPAPCLWGLSASSFRAWSSTTSGSRPPTGRNWFMARTITNVLTHSGWNTYSVTYAATISDYSSTTCISTSPSGPICNSACLSLTSRWHRP